MTGPQRDLLHAACLSAGATISLVGAVVFRTAADSLQAVAGSVVIALGGLVIYAGFRQWKPVVERPTAASSSRAE